MQYLGGKERVATSLTAFMQPYVDGAYAYYEPFLGGASIGSRIKCSSRFLSDANAPLMVMWDHVVNKGWVPPTEVSEELYKELKAKKDPHDPMTAFVGFGCSFGAKWFGGYARSSNVRSYAQMAHNSVLRKARGLKGAAFCVGDYRNIPISPKALVYCDIPYSNAQKHSAVGHFDHGAFWNWARELSKSCTVIVSEFEAPDDFDEIWAKPMPSGIRGMGGATRNMVEKLFRIKQ